jgi:hypothetical protein
VSRGVLIAALAVLAAVPGAADAAPLISQGAYRMGADAFWSRGSDGTGERVAILDEGFGGLDRSIALGELPSRDRMRAVSFDADNGLDGRGLLGAQIQHGTRMAELIHDVAPGAELVLVNYGTVDEFLRAVDWIAASGIPIVSHSNSFLEPPFDGRGRAARAVEEISARGVLWVNSAGNYAERHWVGRAVGGAVIPLPRVAPQPLSFSLSWPRPDVRAELSLEVRGAGGGWVEVARSENRGDWAQLESPGRAEEMRLVVRQTAGPEVELELFSQSIRFGPLAVAEGSVPTPADAPSALAVGAVRWTGGTRVSYSSYGPTADGRAKPEIVAPTYVTSNPEWPGTAGTSAATAHAAGAAVLLRARWRLLGLEPTGAALRARLIATARDVGGEGVDAEHGAGVVRIDTSAPRPRVTIVRSRTRATVRAWARDAGTIGRIEVLVDGRRVRSRAAARAKVSVPRPASGRVRIEVRAEDMAGNVGRITRWLSSARSVRR